jgi:hypothetical protein
LTSETFALAWIKAPGSAGDIVGSLSLPSRPTTLGEARGGLEAVAGDAPTASWLRTWAESNGEERSIVLRLPGGWFELTAATVAPVAGAQASAGEHYLICFDRRSLVTGPAE